MLKPYVTAIPLIALALLFCWLPIVATVTNGTPAPAMPQT